MDRVQEIFRGDRLIQEFGMKIVGATPIAAAPAPAALMKSRRVSNFRFAILRSPFPGARCPRRRIVRLDP